MDREKVGGDIIDEDDGFGTPILPVVKEESDSTTTTIIQAERQRSSSPKPKNKKKNKKQKTTTEKQQKKGETTAFDQYTKIQKQRLSQFFRYSEETAFDRSEIDLIRVMFLRHSVISGKYEEIERKIFGKGIRVDETTPLFSGKKRDAFDSFFTKFWVPCLKASLWNYIAIGMTAIAIHPHPEFGGFPVALDLSSVRIFYRKNCSQSHKVFLMRYEPDPMSLTNFFADFYRPTVHLFGDHFGGYNHQKDDAPIYTYFSSEPTKEGSLTSPLSKIRADAQFEMFRRDCEALIAQQRAMATIYVGRIPKSGESSSNPSQASIDAVSAFHGGLTDPLRNNIFRQTPVELRRRAELALSVSLKNSKQLHDSLDAPDASAGSSSVQNINRSNQPLFNPIRRVIGEQETIIQQWMPDESSHTKDNAEICERRIAIVFGLETSEIGSQKNSSAAIQLTMEKRRDVFQKWATDLDSLFKELYRIIYFKEIASAVIHSNAEDFEKIYENGELSAIEVTHEASLIFESLIDVNKVRELYYRGLITNATFATCLAKDSGLPLSSLVIKNPKETFQPDKIDPILATVALNVNSSIEKAPNIVLPVPPPPPTSQPGTTKTSSSKKRKKN